MIEKVPQGRSVDTNVDAVLARRVAKQVAARLGLTVDAHDGSDFDVFASPAAALTGDVRLVTREDHHIAVIDFGGRVNVDVAHGRVETTVLGEPDCATLNAVAGASPRLRVDLEEAEPAAIGWMSPAR